jgi:DNA-binding transcriptional LysR family regulator
MQTSEPWTAAGGDPHPIDLRRLQVFVSSARSLSFAASAQQLGLTPSAVSHAIRSLEEELSCILFQRHGPRVTLTRAGIRLLPIARDLLSRMESLRAEVALIEDESRQLRVMVPEILCSTLLPRILPSFFECFPSIRFEVQVGESGDFAAGALAERHSDLFIGWNAELPGDTVRRELFVEEFAIHIAPFHPLARFPRVDARELARHTLLIPQPGLLDALASRGLADPVRHGRVWMLPGVESAREFARVGLGAAVLSKRSASAAVEAGWLKILPVSAPRIEIACSAFWHGQVQPSWAAEAFLSLVEVAGDP